MISSDNKTFPRCNANNCFAKQEILGTNRCMCLKNTDFNGRACPFYKSKARMKEERKLYPIPVQYRG